MASKRATSLDKLRRSYNDLVEDIDGVEYQYKLLQTSFAVRKTRLIDRFTAFKKDNNLILEDLASRMDETTTDYSRYTIKRSKHGLLSPIAFCLEEDLPKHLGAPISERVFTLTWCAQFQQLSADGMDTGMLEMAGISATGLMSWWTSGDVDRSQKETRVWADLKALAFKTVRLLDNTNIDSSNDASPLLRSLKDVEYLRQIRGLTFKLKKLVLNVIRLVFLRHEYFNDIRPLYELIVPSTYALTVLIGFGIEDWRRFGRHVVSMLECYVSAVINLKEEFATHLCVTDELESFEQSDNEALAISKPNREAKQTNPEEPRPIVNKFPLCQETLQALKHLGLTEIDVDYERGGEEVGNGSFARVYRHPLKNGDYPLAIKFVKVEKAPAERIKRRLIREASIWMQLSHKNISTLLGICRHPEEDIPGLVSSYCPYKLEGSHMKKRSESEKLGYLLDVAEGLDYMHRHEKRIIHGDLRPANVLLAPDLDFDPRSLKAVLCDFGVADVDEDFTTRESTTMQHTNDYYLAPELLANKISSGFRRKRRISTEGDVYAFGCVFFEVVYGKSPFHYDNTNFIKIKKSGGFPARREEVQDRHWELLERTWALNKANRPTSKQLVQQVQNIVLAL